MNIEVESLAFVPAAALAGGAIGWLHFASLARVSELFVAGRIAAVGLQLARFAILGAFLFLCARGGAGVLIAAAAGVLAARAAVMKRAG